jgi:hypothetical protein
LNQLISTPIEKLNLTQNTDTSYDALTGFVSQKENEEKGNFLFILKSNEAQFDLDIEQYVIAKDFDFSSTEYS